MKLLIDADRLAQLIGRKDESLGEALVADIEAIRGISLSEVARNLAVSSFETGYAAALTNVVRILEAPCQTPAKGES